MSEKEKNLENLVDEALTNARKDRDRLLETWESMKDALDSNNQEKTVLMGQTAVKLLEQINKANEQIVKLAQIKERQETKLATLNPSNDDKGPLDIDDIKIFVESQNSQKN